MLFRRRAIAGTLTRSLMVAEVEAGGQPSEQLHFCIPAWLCWTARCPIRTGENAAPHGPPTSLAGFLLLFCVAEDTPYEEPVQAADHNEGQRFGHGPRVDGRKQADQEDCDIGQFCHDAPLLKCANWRIWGEPGGVRANSKCRGRVFAARMPSSSGRLNAGNHLSVSRAGLRAKEFWKM